MASGKPVSPSTHAMKISLTPRFCTSVSTESQNAGSFRLGNPHAQQFLLSVQVDRQHQVERFIDHALVLTHFDDQAIDVDDWVDWL